MPKPLQWLAPVLVMSVVSTQANAGGIRDHTRLNHEPGTIVVSKTQANELSLTRVKVGLQKLQSWIRLAAEIDHSGHYLSARLCTPEADLIQSGQRVRVFPPDSKSSIYQARVSQLKSDDQCVTIKARLSRNIQQQTRYYVMEILLERGRFMSIPKEAIIEEGDKQIVYVQQRQGHYIPQQIQTGIKGELYTEILAGLEEGDQVVSLGSFFIDAEYKLKSVQQTGAGDAHLHH